MAAKGWGWLVAWAMGVCPRSMCFGEVELETPSLRAVATFSHLLCLPEASISIC